MTKLFFVLFVAIFAVALAADECSAPGDGSVDWTKETQTWYYCQTSQAGRKNENCYVNFKTKGENKLSAIVYQYKIESDSKTKDSFKMEYTGDGKYSYPELNTVGVSTAVTPNGDCVAYLKCPETAAYFMFMCKDKSLCKKQSEYEGDYKKVIDDFKSKHPDMKIEDINQETCKKVYSKKY